MAKEKQGAEKGGEDVWRCAVKGFPDGVGDGVRPWGRGGSTLCLGSGDLSCSESCAVCKDAEDGGEGPRELGGKK